MLDRFRGKKVTVFYIESIGTSTIANVGRVKGILTDFDNDFVMLDNAICINRKLIIRIDS